MSMTPLKREKTPILEDDDPFAARRLLPKTWVARAAGPPVTPSSRKQKRFSPLSPPPFSALVPLQPRNSTRQSSFGSPPVEEEPVVSRKPSPAALPKHPQFYEFSSNATSNGISDDSKLFNTAPFPPPRLAEAEESPLTPKPMTTHETGKLKKARFTELVDLSPTHARINTRPISSLLLARSSKEPLYPGSTFSFSLSRSSLVNTPLPLSVKITFSGTTCTSNLASANEHLLFQLSSSVELPEATWNGVSTIPLSSICCTCDTANETLPPSFSHRRENGSMWRTSYSVTASCEGYETAELEIKVGTRHRRLEPREIVLRGGMQIEGSLKTWQMKEEPVISLELSLKDEEEEEVRFSTPLSLRVLSKFRFISTRDTPNFDALLAAFSPSQSSAALQTHLLFNHPTNTIPIGTISRNQPDFLDIRARSTSEELVRGTVVEVSQTWIVDTSFGAWPYSTSCAGFSLQPVLIITLGECGTRSSGVQIQVPFDLSPPPPRTRARSHNSPTLLPLPAEDSTSQTQMSTKAQRQVSGRGADADGSSVNVLSKEIARSRWKLLRRVFIGKRIGLKRK